MKTILLLAGNDYEDLELWYPKLRLEEAGHRVVIAGLGDKTYTGKNGYPVTVDGNIADFAAKDLDGIVVPGGWAPDKWRRDANMKARTKELFEEGKLVATICHGGWLLISAGIVRGKKLTGTTAIKDDLENAGATWVDAPVVIDGNHVSSRVPKDLPAFGKALVEWLAVR
jgi:protease I